MDRARRSERRRPDRGGGKRGTRRMSLQHELRKRRPFDSPAEEAYLNLLRTVSVLGAPFAAILRAHGLSESTYNVLRILRGHHPQGLPSLAIGEQMVARVPDVTRLVDRLVARGLAERVRTDQDRRVVIVRATRAALDLLAKLDKPLADVQKRQLAHLSPRELATLNRLLVKARSPHMEGRPDAPPPRAPRRRDPLRRGTGRKARPD